ncbi:unnamed protein product, partial [Fusarium langsethiae]
MSSLASFASSDGRRSVAPVSSSSELPSSASPAPQITSSSNGRTTRKRKTTANIWAHAREPQNLEPARYPRKNEKIYYCMHCIDPTYSTIVSTTFRHHLCKVHGIESNSHDHPVKKQRDSLIQDAFAKAGEVSAAKQLMRQEDTLRAAVNRKAALEALVQLVTAQRLVLFARSPTLGPLFRATTRPDHRWPECFDSLLRAASSCVCGSLVSDVGAARPGPVLDRPQIE